MAMTGVRLHAPREMKVEQLSDPKPPAKGEVLIRVGAAGICGSDLHTYLDAQIGDTKLRGPLVLGHEFAGTVEQVGDDAFTEDLTGLQPGMRVAVDPAQPCGLCELCLRGHPNLCTSLHFCGLYPDGGCFCERIVMPARSCFPLPDAVDLESGALLEPLGVALHAVDLAKPTSDESAVIVGAGPIGLLILQAATLAGMKPVYVVEQLPWRLSLVEKFGGIPIDSARTNAREKLMIQTLGRGVDVAFEAAWADSTIQLAAEMTRHGGCLVLVGIPREDQLTLQHSTARRKGLTILLSRRMKHTYPRAIDLVAKGLIDVKSLVSHRFPLTQVPQAFSLNADYRDHVVKVMITY
ncbi:MAG: alcohol dehydrogenase catalytic domain-containing protein [Ignavibacteriales bacterium]|nr:alcohol dehydrogenase catalytic domain-containing protein [Ignavibacteriales bacterium]